MGYNEAGLHYCKDTILKRQEESNMLLFLCYFASLILIGAPFTILNNGNDYTIFMVFAIFVSFAIYWFNLVRAYKNNCLDSVLYGSMIILLIPVCLASIKDVGGNYVILIEMITLVVMWIFTNRVINILNRPKN